MDPTHDFLNVETAPHLAAPDRPRSRRGGPVLALARAIGFVVLVVTVCSPLWGLMVFFALH
jgi:hypothetical protein